MAFALQAAFADINIRKRRILLVRQNSATTRASGDPRAKGGRGKTTKPRLQPTGPMQRVITFL
jgi:hypothetical protein